MTRSMPLIAAALLMSLSLSSPALAHKVIADGYVAGNTIEGEIGFSNGDMAAHAVIEVFDENNTKVDELTTDGDGFFVYKPKQRMTYVFRVNLGAGHLGEFTIPKDDLPADVGAAQPAAAAAPAAAPATTSAAEGTTAPATAAPTAPAVLPAQVKQMIAETVRAEVRPLRREILAFKEHHDFQQILGGIGYIIGLFGVAFFLMARRRSGASS